MIPFNWLGQSYCIKLHCENVTYIKFPFASGKIEEQVQF